MSAAQETVAVDDIYRDPTTEHWLDGWGVNFYLTTIPVSAIDFTASRAYQNRGDATTIKEHVDSIATMMGDPAYTVPPIVVTSGKRGSLVVIDGNHRGLAAVKAGRSELHAYVVASDDRTVHLMAMAANARNAQHVTIEMRDRLIVASVAGGLPQSVVAAQWGISADAVGFIRRTSQGRSNLHSIGVDVRQVGSKKAEVASQLDREHLVAIGPKLIAEVSGEQLRSIKQEIESAPPSGQIEAAKAAARRVSEARAAGNTPAAKRRASAAGMSAVRVVNSITKVTAAIQGRPELAKDEKVAAALSSLAKVVK